MNTIEFKIFIANLGKYNEGKMVGEWINLPATEEELEEVLDKIGIKEGCDEYFIPAYENEFGYKVDEYADLDELNELADKLDNLTDNEKKILEAGTELWSFEDVLDNLDSFYLMEDINTDYDLGCYWIEESGCYDLDSLGVLRNYIDYEAFGRDIRLEFDGDFTSYGWIERH